MYLQLSTRKKKETKRIRPVLIKAETRTRNEWLNSFDSLGSRSQVKILIYRKAPLISRILTNNGNESRSRWTKLQQLWKLNVNLNLALMLLFAPTEVEHGKAIGQINNKHNKFGSKFHSGVQLLFF